MFIFYIICFFCFLEGCEEKREMGLSYKEVGTEVFLLDGDEEKSVLALDVAANLDTIDWFFRDKHNYLQPSVFFYINNRTCETLSVYVQELYRKDRETWILLPCSVSQVNFENVIFPRKHTIFRLDAHYSQPYLCAVTFNNNDYGKRKSKLSGGI